MKPVEIEFLLRDRTEEGLDRMSGNLDGVRAKYNSTRATVAALQKEVEKLQGKKLSSGIDSSVNTAQIDTLKKKITELRAEVAALEKEYPELGKTVSGTPLVPPDAQKVKSTYNGLHNSIQQIAREMPALAMGPQTFFLAISNNLPIFTDELARAKKEYNELVQSGKKGVPVWKQILSSLFSWQTALTTGIMLLVMYGDEIVRWVSDLFKGKKAIDSVTDAIGSMHEAIDAENLAGQIANFEKLARAYRAIGDNAEEKQKFLTDYKDEIEKTGAVISDIYDADNLFIDNADRFVESIQKRALALAGMELAKEQYQKAIEIKAENSGTYSDLDTARNNRAYYANEYNQRLSYLKANNLIGNPLYERQLKASLSNYNYWNDQVNSLEDKIENKIESRIKTFMDAGNTYLDAANYLDEEAADILDDAGIETDKDIESGDVSSSQDLKKRLTERLAKMEADAQTDVSEMTVKAMKEGYERERKEAELEFEQEKARIRQELEERLALYAELREAGVAVPVGAEERTKALAATQTAKAGMVYSNRLAQIDAQERSDEEERLQKTESELQKLLDKYRDYEAQRTAIKEQGDKDIAALEAARTEANSEEIDRAIEVARQKIQDGIQGINDTEARSTTEDSGFFKRLFGDWSSMSFNSLKELISQARQLKEYLSGSGDADGITFITPEQLEAIENSPEELGKVKKALDGLLNRGSGGSSKWSNIFKTFEKGLAKLKGAEDLDDISGAIGTIGDAASDAAGELSDMFEAMGNDAVADAMEGTQQVLGAVANIGEGFAKGGIIGAVGAAVGEIAKFATSAIEAANRHAEALKEIENARLSFQRQYNLLLLEQNLLLEEASTIFGERQILKAANALEVFRQAQEDLDNALRNSGLNGNRRSGGIGSSSSVRRPGSGYNNARSAYDEYLNGLGSATIVTGHEKTGLFGWGKGRDVYSSILEVYPELIDESGKLDTVMLQTILDTRKMSDETRAYLENLLDLNDVMEEAKEALHDYLQETYGGLGDGILDSVVAAIDGSKGVLEGFAGSVGDTFEDLGEQLAYSLYFADEFDRLQKDLEELYGSGKSEKDITEDSMDLLDQFYDNISDNADAALEWMRAWQEKAAEKGFDIWNDGTVSQTGKAGSFETMTQEQGTKLEGLFTSGQIHWASMDTTLDGMGEDMSEGLDCLRNIESNTAGSLAELRAIRSDMSVIIRDGVKAR
jgi:hypothetical protein